MKVCTKCGVEKDLRHFTPDPRYNGGRRHQCSACRNRARSPEDQARWRHRTRRAYRAWLGDVKEKAGCCDCPPGTWWPREALDFDHVPGRGAKEFELGHGHNRTEDAVLAEMQKCDVVCANHHRIRTVARSRGDGYAE